MGTPAPSTASRATGAGWPVPVAFARPDLHPRRCKTRSRRCAARSANAQAKLPARLVHRRLVLGHRVRRPRPSSSAATAPLHEQFADIGIPRDGGLADLLAEAASPEPRFAAVICEDIERSGRDTFNALKLERQLADAGIPLFATDEPIDIDGVNATTVLIRRVKQGVAEWFRLQIKEKAWNGLREHSLAGWNIGPAALRVRSPSASRTPCPFKAAQGRTKTRLALDPDRAPAVAAIFTVADRGPARRARHRHPAQRRPRTPTRRPSAALDRVRRLRHPAQPQVHRAHGVRPPPHRTNGRGPPVPPDQWLWSPEPTHPAIITRDIWDAAQAIGAEHSTSRDDPGAEHPPRHPPHLRAALPRPVPRLPAAHVRRHPHLHAATTAAAPAYANTYYAVPPQPRQPPPRRPAPDHPPPSPSAKTTCSPSSASSSTSGSSAPTAPPCSPHAARHRRRRPGPPPHARPPPCTKRLRQIDAAENAHAREIEALAHHHDATRRRHHRPALPHPRPVHRTRRRTRPASPPS